MNLVSSFSSAFLSNTDLDLASEITETTRTREYEYQYQYQYQYEYQSVILELELDRVQKAFPLPAVQAGSDLYHVHDRQTGCAAGTTAQAPAFLHRTLSLSYSQASVCKED